MKQKDIKPLKEKIWIKNNKKCPVLDKEIELDKIVLDHAHKRNDEAYSESKGVIRESLDFRVNATLGKLENSLKRTGLIYTEGFNISQFLHNAADYFERGPYRDEEGNLYVHPTEVTPEPKLMKRSYNELKKIYDKKAKFPEYPKSKKLTKQLKNIYEYYNMTPKFY